MTQPESSKKPPLLPANLRSEAVQKRKAQQEQIGAMAEAILSRVFIDEEIPVPEMSRYLLTVGIAELEKAKGFDRARWIDSIIRVMKLEFDARKTTDKAGSQRGIDILSGILDASGDRSDYDGLVKDIEDEEKAASGGTGDGHNDANGRNGSKRRKKSPK